MSARRGFPANWIAAAQYERERRPDHFGNLIAKKKVDPDRAEANYQAWCAIAEWLEQGRSTDLCLMIGWPTLEEAAQKQLADLDDRLARSPSAELKAHRDAVWCIHNLLVKQRELIEPTKRPETSWARPPVLSHAEGPAEAVPA